MGVDVSKNCFGVVALSTFSGGMGALMAGGDFWKGAESGFIVGAFNAGKHAAKKALGNFHRPHGGWVSEASVEVTKGYQVAGYLKHGIGINLNLASKRVVQFGNKNGRGYTTRGGGVKTLDVGGAWGGGANYNANVENGKIASHTLSVGGLGVLAGSITWNGSGITNWTFGLQISGKIALGVGIEGSLKAIYSQDY